MDSRTSRLKNGLRVVSIKLPHVESVTVAAFVNVGSRFETPELNGISHYLEHMAFKGTPTRTGEQIDSEIEFLGADINASTSKDRTAYYVSGLAENTETFVDLISDILSNSTFPEEEIERERSVILQEITAGRDSRNRMAHHLHDGTQYPNQALGRPIIGTPENVKSFKREDLIAYMKRYYTASNMIVGIVGKVDHDEALKLIEQYFGGFEEGTMNQYTSAEYTGGYAHDDLPFEQSTLMLSFPCANSLAPEHYAEAVAACVLGDGMSSPLFSEVRNKRGLVYSINAFTYLDEDHGSFYIGAGTTPENFQEVLDVTVDEMLKLTDHVSERDLQRAKNQIRVHLIRGQERGFGLLQNVVENLFVYGYHPELSDTLAKIEAVTIDDVKATFKRILSRKPTLTITGPGGNQHYYERIVAKLDHLRSE